MMMMTVTSVLEAESEDGSFQRLDEGDGDREKTESVDQSVSSENYCTGSSQGQRQGQRSVMREELVGHALG